MADDDVGCARPTGSVVGAPPAKKHDAPVSDPKETSVGSIMVGRKAPDFVAPAYHKGAFTQVKLSDYPGQVGGPVLLPG